MLEIAVTTILEIANLFVSIKDPHKKSKKSVKGLIKLYWILERIEEHGALFIEGLKVILTEKRVPTRLTQALRYLEADLDEFDDLFDDKFGLCRNFWHIIDIAVDTHPSYPNTLSNNLYGIIGVKYQRLYAWRALLHQAGEKIGDPDKSYKLIVLTEKFSESQYAKKFDYYDHDYHQKIEDLSLLIKTEKVRILNLNDPQEVKDYIKSAQKTQHQVKKIKERLGDMIKNNFNLTDLFDAI